MDPGLAVLLCSLGGIFLLTALILKLVAAGRSRSCTASALGTVVGIRTQRSTGRRAFYSVYRYPVGGRSYEGSGGYLSGHLTQAGEAVPVSYDPQNPRRSYIPGYDDRILAILTAAFTIIGAIPILICLGIWLLA